MLLCAVVVQLLWPYFVLLFYYFCLVVLLLFNCGAAVVAPLCSYFAIVMLLWCCCCCTVVLQRSCHGALVVLGRCCCCAGMFKCNVVRLCCFLRFRFRRGRGCPASGPGVRSVDFVFARVGSAGSALVRFWLTYAGVEVHCVGLVGFRIVVVHGRRVSALVVLQTRFAVVNVGPSFLGAVGWLFGAFHYFVGFRSGCFAVGACVLVCVSAHGL